MGATFQNMTSDERAYDRSPKGQIIDTAINQLNVAALKELTVGGYITRDSQLMRAIGSFVRRGNPRHIAVVAVMVSGVRRRDDAIDTLATWRTYADDVASGCGRAASERAKKVKRIMGWVARDLSVTAGLH